jgi:hypothetical protein
MPSDKTAVIEHLFFAHWDHSRQQLSKSIFDQNDVIAAIEACNKKDGLDRSPRNAPNFLKDLIRKSSASKNWPTSVSALRYTAEQRYGDGQVFEFVPYAPTQTEPFPDKYIFRDGVTVHPVQSLTILSEAKKLGRKDEAWLTQTAVKLAVAETHFALESPRRGSIVDVIHLQMNLKLRRTEMDAIYMARYGRPGNLLIAAITCEAKQANERIIETQLVEQAKAAFSQAEFAIAIPIAMRAVRKRGIYVAEFEAVSARQASSYVCPALVAEALYELKPPVPGI